MKKPFPPRRPLPPAKIVGAYFNVHGKDLRLDKVSACAYKYYGFGTMTLEDLISQVKSLGVPEKDFCKVTFQLKEVFLNSEEVKAVKSANIHFEKRHESYLKELAAYQEAYKEFELQNALYFQEKKIKTAKNAVKTLKAAGVNVEKLLQEQGE